MTELGIKVKVIIDLLDQDIKLNGDQPLTISKYKKILEIALADDTKE
jgi:hypothetical protein